MTEKRRRAVRVIDIMSLLILAYFAAAAVPLQYFWFVPGPLVVEDTTVGVPAQIGFNRSIKRPVQMSYSVTIRRAAGFEIVCEDRSAIFTYRPDASLPLGIDLAWWAPGDDRCANLYPPGGYLLETCWTASNILWGILPDKTACVESNVFMVRPT